MDYGSVRSVRDENHNVVDANEYNDINNRTNSNDVGVDDMEDNTDDNSNF